MSDSSSDDDVPLSQLQAPAKPAAKPKAKKQPPPSSSSSSDDDEPVEPPPKKRAKRLFSRLVRLHFSLCAPIVLLRDATFLQMTRLLQVTSTQRRMTLTKCHWWRDRWLPFQNGRSAPTLRSCQ